MSDDIESLARMCDHEASKAEALAKVRSWVPDYVESKHREAEEWRRIATIVRASESRP